MTKQTGTTITLVVAILTLCCSLTCCAAGIFILIDQNQTIDIDAEPYVAGIPTICLGVIVWIIPLLLWLILVRGKEEPSAA